MPEIYICLYEAMFNKLKVKVGDVPPPKLGFSRCLYVEEVMDTHGLLSHVIVCGTTDCIKIEKILTEAEFYQQYVTDEMISKHRDRAKLEVFTKNPTEAKQLEKINEKWDNIKLFLDPSEKVQLAAVHMCAHALKYIKNPTEAVCFAALKKNGTCLQYIQNYTYEMCKVAVKETYCALEHVRRDMLTEELCMIAIEVSGYALQFVPAEMQTKKMCLAAVRKHGIVLKYVKKQTASICWAAIKETPYASQYITIDVDSDEDE